MSNVLRFSYRFTLEDQSEKVFTVSLDHDNLDLLNSPPETVPGWARLDFYQCKLCPLAADTTPNCPVAVQLAPLMEWCNGLNSHDNVDIEVSGETRLISGPTTIQRAVSSLMGLIMATSGCPHTDFLRPMARFHLPLATDHETVYRAVSMFLLGEYLAQQGTPAAPDISVLESFYRNLQAVNMDLARRLRHATENDSGINAVILLDLLGKSVHASLEDALQDLRPIFSSYLVNRARLEPNQ